MLRRSITPVLVSLLASVLASGLSACAVDVDFTGTRFNCIENACPEGFECREARCVLADSPVLPGPFRRALTTSYAGDATEVNFPLLVTLNDDLIDYADAGPGGETIRFTDSSGILRPHEIDHWDPNGTSTIWLSVDSLVPGQDNLHYLYWGATDPPSVLPSHLVWDDTTVAVWHLDDNPALGAVGAVLDSTIAEHHGTASASMDSDSLEVGPIGLALSIDDADDSVIVADNPAFELPDYSYSFWIRGDNAPTSAGGNSQPIYNADDQFNFSWDHEMPEFAQSAAHRGADGVFVPSKIATPLEADTYYAITVTFDGQTLTVYLNGVRSQSAVHQPPVAVDGPFAFGNDPDVVRFSGALDELRIHNSALSAARISAIYASSLPGFVTLGTLEQP